ncbi:nucleotidyltransferase domain-containing protein [Parendozoicomonas haliclonae]|uniref:Nucleotidyltransferase domain protein n=1 Tax=Parendozoicomonas haliclonae TaxID=1960125 RepID=A0A1X7ARH8_9GAMM|nr:nucleotidyltransferase domain-containing protein [Parendozoicomonas haliclonae]SMA50742.1 Nucleotidyltransferase domain protein [Parendozoicomonas haliclonae]
MNNQSLIGAAVAELNKKYQPHTIIVYGSRARGDFTETSDLDIACFTDHSPKLTDARLWQGIYLDAWIYHTDSMAKNEQSTLPLEYLRFADGYCVQDQQGKGQVFLDQVKARLAEGPKCLSENEKAHTVEWIGKMLNRAAQDDIEGNYRQVWLQFELLEIYFQLRDLWYFGPKKSFVWLQDNDPLAYQLFKAGYESPADSSKLKTLAAYIINNRN